MDPLLKWAGGKSWQVPVLKRIWRPHTHRRLVEPFCGSLSVALALEPARALMNDANPHLINFYRQVQQGVACDLELRIEDYTHHRDWFNDLIAHDLAMTPDGARLFYYLNRCGFNGLCRFNSSGGFNVPVGRPSSGVKPFSPVLARHVLKRYEFTCGDFGDVVLEPDDFVYADPPYDDGFTSYTGNAFTWDDQERIALLLAGHPGPVLLTNLATDRILNLYRHLGYWCTTMSAPRRISAKGNRSPVLEVLATNFPIDSCVMMGVQHQQFAPQKDTK
jgi:DNA adenine methylase